MRHFFFDMDGVLAVYEREAYDRRSGPEPGVALFEHERSHYFRNCRPDRYALELMKKVNADAREHRVFVLTAVAPHISTWAIQDKRDWLAAYCPYLDLDSQFIVAQSDKAETARAKAKLKTLTKSVLLDDYNPNLIAWERAGGAAVKYLNGVNSPESWTGHVIDGRKRALFFNDKGDKQACR